MTSPTNPLANENCVYTEWDAGDGGQHTFSPTWWLSPDIEITGPKPNQGTLGTVNKVQCRPHAVAGCLPDDALVKVEAWVGIPSSGLVPNQGMAENIGKATVPASTVGPGGTLVNFNWRPTGAGVQVAGHRCLVLRVYPDFIGNPSSKSFFMEERDRHVAQHNIDIVVAASSTTPNPPPGVIPPSGGGGYDIPIGTANLGDEPIEMGYIVDQEPHPDPEEFAVLEPLLDQEPDFTGFTDAELVADFGFPDDIEVNPWEGVRPPTTRLPDGLELGIGDVLGGLTLDTGVDIGGKEILAGDVVGGRYLTESDPLVGFRIPNGTVLRDARLTLVEPLRPLERMRWGQLEARQWRNARNGLVRLPPGFVGTYTVHVDLKDVASGEATVLHAQQIDSHGRPHGGVTVVVIRGH
jgi:hypothetical protein